MKVLRFLPALILSASLFIPLQGLAEEGMAEKNISARESLHFSFSDENLRLGFSLDSTLHMIHGIAHDVNGEVIAHPSETGGISYSVSLSFPVKGLDTDSEKRDHKMRYESLDMVHYPTISFRSAGFSGFPAKPAKGETFSFQLQGDLTIKDVTKRVSIPTQVTPVAENPEMVHVSGRLPLKWADYHVEDPSVFIFTVHDTMEIYYDFDLPSRFLYR